MIDNKSTHRFALAAVALAALVAAASLGAIMIPSVYAREVPIWAAQGLGQDWVDLAVVVPLLVISAVGVLRGRRTSFLLLAGAIVYTLYSFVIYAFAVHFNVLFLVYCAVVGLSFFTLVGLGNCLLREDPRNWFDAQSPVRLAGGYLMASAVLFYILWLSEVIPALWHGTVPSSITEAGLTVNPVHVLDLAIVLPALFAAGLSIWRRRALGYFLAPIMLVFTILMSLGIGGMVVSMHLRGLVTGFGLAGVFGVMALVSTGILGLLLRRLRACPP